MPLEPGSPLGPYEILASIGAGGMGEVYRARDPRLGRDVAVKVLPGPVSNDPERLKRFEQEARAAGALNHPNLTAVYDFGTNPGNGAPYIVTELLEGETLRMRLTGGAIPLRKATDYAIQIARGLAAAHEKGIIHRDLKPENLIVTHDGRVKILDFGLASWRPLDAGRERTSAEHDPMAKPALTGLPTADKPLTEPGIVMGTLGYMSPEQVKGKPADQRSDLFAFGAILYEMISGVRAFHRDTAAETISAILREEPPDLSTTNAGAPSGLDRIVRHCLEKNPEERFYSAKDLAFDLEALSDVSGESAASKPASANGGASAAPRKRSSWLIAAGAALLTALVCAAIARVVIRRAADRPPPTFQQLSFRRGQIYAARFAPDGQTVLYSAAWDDKPLELFVGRRESPESRAFGLPDAEILSISSSGEMAMSLDRKQGTLGFRRTGTLAQLSVAGGAAPREILKDVEFADWAPDGKSLAVIRGGRELRIEYPIGKVLYQPSNWASHLRVSPDGELVAFIDHPVANDDGGAVVVIDRSGRKRSASPPFASVQGLAWSRDGSEVWFTAAQVGGNRAIYSAGWSKQSQPRLRLYVPGTLTLQDVSKDGGLLLTRDMQRSELFSRAPGDARERDLTWLDWSLSSAISADGKRVVFTESGEGGGPGYSVYIRKTDGSPAVRLGEGSSQDLSSDGEWVTAILHPASAPQLVAYPTGAGEPKLFPNDGVEPFRVWFVAGGKQICFSGSEPGHPTRAWVRDFAGGKPRALTPEGYNLAGSSTSDGKWVPVRGPDRKAYLYPISGGDPIPVPGIEPGESVCQHSADGRSLYVYRTDRNEIPLKVYRVEIATGRRELWKELVPVDPAGVSSLNPLLTPDATAYVYTYNRILSDLYLVEGFR